MGSLHVILASPPDPEPMRATGVWWERHRAVALVERAPIDVAILAGFAADRAGYAFASGYQAALRALAPDLPPDRVASLCVTERGGGHPRAIETRLSPLGGGQHKITGKKRWGTLSGQAGLLLVAASTGADPGGKNRLRLVRVDSTAPGIKLHPMPEPPFTPEVSHDEVELDGVLVRDEDILPGDGFDAYVRPFRTLEDLHVSAAIFAYLVREIRAHDLPRALAERFVALLVSLRALAALSPSAPEAHLALAGVMDLARAPLDELDRVWKKTESPAHARWERDRLVLSIAAQVRERRRERAWERLVAPGSEEESSVG